MKKSTLLAALTKVVGAPLTNILKEAEGTDFESPEGEKLLKEHIDLLSQLTTKELKILFSGDYEQGSEGHYFNRSLLPQVHEFVKDAGKTMGWDPESYLDPDQDCMSCEKSLEQCDCEICEKCEMPSAECQCGDEEE
jgi:hypothetical protein